VNNAAAGVYGSLVDYPLRRRRVMFEVNVHAPIDLAQAAIPGMRRCGEGWIVNVSSGSARLAAGPPFRREGLALVNGVYGATKAALNRLTNALAVELYGTGIRVNTVEPQAAVPTEGALAHLGDTIRDIPVEPMESMVEATLYLCRCPQDHTGRIDVSRDLLATTGTKVMTLDGTRPL
jgi:citronellol/citronellal dehydrogenase